MKTFLFKHHTCEIDITWKAFTFAPFICINNRLKGVEEQTTSVNICIVLCMRPGPELNYQMTSVQYYKSLEIKTISDISHIKDNW